MLMPGDRENAGFADMNRDRASLHINRLVLR
jgi:hypothetical protein